MATFAALLGLLATGAVAAGTSSSRPTFFVPAASTQALQRAAGGAAERSILSTATDLRNVHATLFPRLGDTYFEPESALPLPTNHVAFPASASGARSGASGARTSTTSGAAQRAWLSAAATARAVGNRAGAGGPDTGYRFDSDSTGSTADRSGTTSNPRTANPTGTTSNPWVNEATSTPGTDTRPTSEPNPARSTTTTAQNPASQHTPRPPDSGPQNRMRAMSLFRRAMPWFNVADWLARTIDTEVKHGTGEINNEERIARHGETAGGVGGGIMGGWWGALEGFEIGFATPAGPFGGVVGAVIGGIAGAGVGGGVGHATAGAIARPGQIKRTVDTHRCFLFCGDDAFNYTNQPSTTTATTRHDPRVDELIAGTERLVANINPRTEWSVVKEVQDMFGGILNYFRTNRSEYTDARKEALTHLAGEYARLGSQWSYYHTAQHQEEDALNRALGSWRQLQWNALAPSERLAALHILDNQVHTANRLLADDPMLRTAEMENSIVQMQQVYRQWHTYSLQQQDTTRANDDLYQMVARLELIAADLRAHPEHGDQQVEGHGGRSVNEEFEYLQRQLVDHLEALRVEALRVEALRAIRAETARAAQAPDPPATPNFKTDAPLVPAIPNFNTDDTSLPTSGDDTAGGVLLPELFDMPIDSTYSHPNRLLQGTINQTLVDHIDAILDAGVPLR